MAKRILSFRKSSAKEFGDKKLPEADIIETGHDRFTVRDVKREGETLTGTLCFNSRGFAKVECKDKETAKVTPHDIPSKALMKSIEITLSNYEGVFSGVKLHISLPWIADILVNTKANDYGL